MRLLPISDLRTKETAAHAYVLATCHSELLLLLTLPSFLNTPTISIRAGDKDNETTFVVHTGLLNSRSKYFYPDLNLILGERPLL
jgi:hypothetical protein